MKRELLVQVEQSVIDAVASQRDKNFNGLSPAQTERLVILQEELAESIQAVSKIMRHGYESTNQGKLPLTNRLHLEEELGHVQNAIHMLTLQDLSRGQIEAYQDTKSRTIRQYLHHN